MHSSNQYFIIIIVLIWWILFCWNSVDGIHFIMKNVGSVLSAKEILRTQSTKSHRKMVWLIMRNPLISFCLFQHINVLSVHRSFGILKHGSIEGWINHLQPINNNNRWIIRLTSSNKLHFGSNNQQTAQKLTTRNPPHTPNFNLYSLNKFNLYIIFTYIVHNNDRNYKLSSQHFVHCPPFAHSLSLKKCSFSEILWVFFVVAIIMKM